MTHDQHESEEKGRRLQEEREELLEKTARIREARRQHHNPPGSEGEIPQTPGKDQVPRPSHDDPRHTDTSVPPGQTNAPAGGTTGGGMSGSMGRRKGQGN